MESPHKPQYGGGIIVNPEFNEGLKGWSSFGEAKIQHIESQGNNFIAAHTRSHHHASISQKLYLDKNKLYTFSGIRIYILYLFPLYQYYSEYIYYILVIMQLGYK